MQENIFHMNENAKGFRAEHLLKLSLLFWYYAALYGIKCIAVYRHHIETKVSCTI